MASSLRWQSILAQHIPRPVYFPKHTVRAQLRHKSDARIDRINSRLPRFLQKYTQQLRNAPLTHITAFLLLHELTAIIPLFGFAGAFHYFNWLPPWLAEGKWVNDGVNKFGNYFRRKGWLGDEDAKRAKAWGVGEGGVRVVVEFATAYALTKMLLPARVILSVWATPWFARVAVSPMRDRIGRVFRRRGGAAAAAGRGSAPGAANGAPSVSPAAGTNAVGGGVIPKL